MVSRLCEEFHCLPSAAWRELQAAPAGLLEQILEARAFAAAYQAYEAAEKKSDVPSSPMVDLVVEIEFDLVREEIEDDDEGEDG